MQLIRSILFDVFIYFMMAVLGIIGAPFAIWSREGAYFFLRSYARLAIWSARVFLGLGVEVRGEIPQGEVVVVAKHQSFFDILVIFNALPRPKFIMKRELIWTPFIGLYALRIGAVAVNRGGKGRTVSRMVKDVDEKRHDPGQLVIYPQGTRVAPGARARYKVGAGVLYQRFGLPCTLVATNAGLFWGRRQVRKKPGLAVVEFLETLPPGMELDEFMALIEQRIEAASDRLHEEGLAGEG